MQLNKQILTRILIVLLYFGAVLLVFVGCKTTTPTLPANSSAHNRDSVRTEYLHDSICVDRWHTIYQCGDTVYVYDSFWRDRWHKIELRDSVYINNTDTVYKQVIVEKKGSTFLRNSGIALWIVIVLAVAFMLYKIFK